MCVENATEASIKPVDLETRKVSTDEMLNSMVDVISSGKVSTDNLRQFLDKKSEGVKIGNTDVIFVSQDHTGNLKMDPALESLAGAPGTKAILVEYFEPELMANARNFPVLGKFLEQVFKAIGGPGVKTVLSNKLAEIAKEKGKPIAVADIANKAEYYYGYSLFPSGLITAPIIFPTLLPITLTYSSMYGINRIHEFITKKGHFDPDKIHEYEKILLDTEDARRVFVAMGTRQLASEYQPRGLEPCRILACYPKAHAMRIVDYLTNQGTLSKVSRRAKQLLYKIYPAIDISVRQYQYKDTLARLAQDPSLAGWQRFSNRSL